MLSFTILNIIAVSDNTLSVILSASIQNIVMKNGILTSVIMLNGVAPRLKLQL